MAAKRDKSDKSAKTAKTEHYDIIRAPVITEKTTSVSEQDKIVFVVDRSATKAKIKAAVESVFGVEVVAVNTLNRKGKSKRFRGRAGRRADFKRAYVTLREGQSIDIATGL